MMKYIDSKHIILTHGAFVSYQQRDNWLPFFENKGYNVIAPQWPFKDTAAATLRNRHPDSRIASLRLNQLLDNHSAIIKNYRRCRSRLDIH